ncbi:c-type cytochrome [Larkinella soli]|uniref:c-type cytochrome n=1 Tax=Larkinella soli TaxID=1770527 RepID=UPI000FFB2887|nr:cytochrome c [Larkinella soli]
MSEKTTFSIQQSLGLGLAGFLLLYTLQACYRANGGDLPDRSHTNRSQAGDTLGHPSRFGFGRPATAREIAVLDIDVRPDGLGLPSGSGTVPAGKGLFSARCAACHGVDGTGGTGGRLVVTAFTAKEKAIGNYWPYATTLFDYIRRAMPYNAPGSLTSDEVYSLTAYLLHANRLLDSTAVLNARSLPKVVMPARKFFVPDDRRGGPEVR